MAVHEREGKGWKMAKSKSYNLCVFFSPIPGMYEATSQFGSGKKSLKHFCLKESNAKIFWTLQIVLDSS